MMSRLPLMDKMFYTSFTHRLSRVFYVICMLLKNLVAGIGFEPMTFGL